MSSPVFFLRVGFMFSGTVTRMFLLLFPGRKKKTIEPSSQAALPVKQGV